MMLKVLIYAYVSAGVSSRKIARKLEEDMALRVLAGGGLPEALHHLRVPQAASQGFQGAVRAARADCPDGRCGESRYVSGGRHEDADRGEQAQGDELQADAAESAVSA
ncbi:MAG: transposase [Nitrococcus mobilis]|nr:transposase [Nitrococcus mobilis]